MFASFCLVFCVVATGVMFGYWHWSLILFRRRIAVDERFLRTTESLEDVELALLAIQVDLVNMQQDLRRVVK